LERRKENKGASPKRNRGGAVEQVGTRKNMKHKRGGGPAKKANVAEEKHFEGVKNLKEDRKRAPRQKRFLYAGGCVEKGTEW